MVLGDQEFCSVELANWFREAGVYFCLRLKYSLCIETEPLFWQQLKEVGLVPGISLYFPGVKVRKTQPIGGFDVACKCPRKYRGISVKEGWFIMTNLSSLSECPRCLQKAGSARSGKDEVSYH